LTILTAVVIFVIIGASAIIITFVAFRMFSTAKKNIKAAGGLEGLKAAGLRAAEAHPANAFPVVAPVGQVNTTRLVWLIFVCSALLSFGLGGFFQYRTIRSARLLQNEGMTTRATVAEKYISEDDEGNETYYVTYTFTAQSLDAGPQQIKRQESVPHEIFARVEKGERIEIIYARSDPKVARIMANYEPGAVSYLPICLGGILGLVDALMTIPFYRRFQKAVRLDVEGIPTTTTVRGLFTSSGEEGTTYYVAYTLPDGQKIRHSIKPALYKQLHVGDTLRIVYLSDNPRVFRPEWG